VPGGHVRIFTRAELTAKLTAAGLTPTGRHHAHGLHSPYWWLKCAVGVHDDVHPAVRGYHRLLVWDIMRKPALTRAAEAALNPVIGKSLVIYARKEPQPISPNGPVVSPSSRMGAWFPGARRRGRASPGDWTAANGADGQRVGSPSSAQRTTRPTAEGDAEPVLAPGDPGQADAAG
jgi:hypothetical protein